MGYIRVGIIALFVIMLSAPTVYAQAEQKYVGSDYCKKCHPAMYDLWKASPHPEAYNVLRDWNITHGGFSVSFCLDCHTTSIKDGATGVGCEVCHGPKDTMTINDMSKFCGRCHIEVQKQFSAGAHADKLSCIQCHDPHGTTIKATTSTKLCSSCHTMTYNSYLNGTHHSNEVTCVDCHMKQQTKGSEDVHTPKFNHNFYPTTRLCFQCHNPHTVRSLVNLDREYSASVANLKEKVNNLQYIDYTKDILVGVLLVIVATLAVLMVINRRRS
ncbi:MAG: ammonia-forming cytochrome c nitrite reductase subunit c552 [Thaumarchaeota archaeon]|nr:ammonia-forming cytochrome c nitrite reductase subunit c552 [Nitrososphaerota archaeon]MCL5317557.1 ammonia-forming cytochrome c nitrite reductase subunit c552 [Nitrososphaerota archaeon]